MTHFLPKTLYLSRLSFAMNIAPSVLFKTSLASPTASLTKSVVGVREYARSISKTRLNYGNPSTIMIVTKACDIRLQNMTRQVALWIIQNYASKHSDEFTVLVDSQFSASPAFQAPCLDAEVPGSSAHVRFWTPSLCASISNTIDLVLTIGGDGTVLYVSWLFQGDVPAVIPFHLGSLGFLTVFDFKNYQTVLAHAFSSEMCVNVRTRFACTIHASPGALETPKSCDPDILNCEAPTSPASCTLSGQLPFCSPPLPPSAVDDMRPQIPRETFQVLNELVVDRGPSGYLCQLELYGDSKHITTVHADGLVVASPTGSTAYSLSAGGSLVHPQVSAILVTPICPHTLSFRPMLLPESMELRVCVPLTSRSSAWASFDGRHRIELVPGDSISVVASAFPFTTISKHEQSTDWFNSLQRCLHWNQRRRQKSITNNL